MSDVELLHSWPSLQAMTPEQLVELPAWQDMLDSVNGTTRIRSAVRPEAKPLVLDIALGECPRHILLWDSEGYPDLHRLWSRLDGLPKELVLALVEKECGDVLQLVEDGVRCVLRLVGLADGRPDAHWFCFSFEIPGGTVCIGLDLPESVTKVLGTLDHLDPNHPYVRGLLRPARFVYCGICIAPEMYGVVQVGDLLLPDAPRPTGEGAWVYEVPDDGAYRLVDAEPQEIAFGDFVDGRWPSVPAPEDRRYLVYVGAKPLAACTLVELGDRCAMRVDCFFDVSEKGE